MNEHVFSQSFFIERSIVVSCDDSNDIDWMSKKNESNEELIPSGRFEDG